MLEATTRLDIPPGYATFYGKGENTSMIKSPIIAGQGFTYDGNLAIESDNHVEKSPHWTNFHVQKRRIYYKNRRIQSNYRSLYRNKERRK